MHGWGGDTRSFDFFAQSLSICRTCILIDFPPFGKSDEPNKTWCVQDYSDMVLSLLAYIGVKKFCIVAHSFGGRVAIELSSKTSLVEKQLLTSPAGIKNKNFAKRIKIFWYKILKKLAKCHLYSQQKLAQKGSSDYKNLSPTMKKTFSNIVEYDQTPLLCKICCPTLLFWGENDKDTPFCFTKVFKKHINNCEVIKVKGSHFAYIQNKNLFLRVALVFFKE